MISDNERKTEPSFVEFPTSCSARSGIRSRTTLYYIQKSANVLKPTKLLAEEGEEGEEGEELSVISINGS